MYPGVDLDHGASGNREHHQESGCRGANLRCGLLRRSEIGRITRAPRSANANAIVWPIPWLAFVTNATRPS
jgi:hypothetical protein